MIFVVRVQQVREIVRIVGATIDELEKGRIHGGADGEHSVLGFNEGLYLCFVVVPERKLYRTIRFWLDCVACEPHRIAVVHEIGFHKFRVLRSLLSKVELEVEVLTVVYYQVLVLRFIYLDI